MSPIAIANSVVSRRWFFNSAVLGLSAPMINRGRYVNRFGDWVVKPRFQAGTRFQEGLAAVKLDGKWEYLQMTGAWFVLPRFDEAQTFQNGRAYARQDGRPVIVSRNGQVSEC